MNIIPITTVSSFSARATPCHPDARTVAGEAVAVSLATPSGEREADVLRFVHGFQQALGYTPSIREIMLGIGSRSAGDVHLWLCWLELDGWIYRLPNRARAIEVLHPPLIPYDHEGRPVYFVRVG